MLKIGLFFLCTFFQIKSNPFTTLSFFLIRKNFNNSNVNNIFFCGLKLNGYKYDNFFFGIYLERKINYEFCLGPEICYYFSPKRFILDLKIVYKNFIFRVGTSLFKFPKCDTLNIFVEAGYINNNCDLAIGYALNQTKKHLKGDKNRQKTTNKAINNKAQLINNEKSDTLSLTASFLNDSSNGSLHDSFSCYNPFNVYESNENLNRQTNRAFEFECEKENLKKSVQYLKKDNPVLNFEESTEEKSLKKEKNTENIEENKTVNQLKDAIVSPFKSNSNKPKNKKKIATATINFKLQIAQMYDLLNKSIIDSSLINELNRNISRKYVELQDIKRQDFLAKSEICQLQELRLRLKNFNLNNIILISYDNSKMFQLSSDEKFIKQDIELALIFSKGEPENPNNNAVKFEDQNLNCKKVQAYYENLATKVPFYLENGIITELNSNYYVNIESSFPLINEIKETIDLKNIIFKSYDNSKKFKLALEDNIDEKKLKLDLIFCNNDQKECKKNIFNFQFLNTNVKKFRGYYQDLGTRSNYYLQNGEIIERDSKYFIDKESFFLLVDRMILNHQKEKMNFFMCIIDKLSYYGYNFYESSHQFDVDLCAFDIWKNILNLKILSKNNSSLKEYISKIHTSLLAGEMEVNEAVEKLNFIDIIAEQLGIDSEFENFCSIVKEQQMYEDKKYNTEWYNDLIQLKNNEKINFLKQIINFFTRVINTCFNLLILDCLRSYNTEENFDVFDMINSDWKKFNRQTILLKLSNTFNSVILLPFFNLDKIDLKKKYKKTGNFQTNNNNKLEKLEEFKKIMNNRNQIRAYYGTYKMLKNKKHNKLSYLNTKQMKKKLLEQLSIPQPNDEETYGNALVNLSDVSEDLSKIKENMNYFNREKNLFFKKITNLKLEDVLDRHIDEKLDQYNNCLTYGPIIKNVKQFLLSKELFKNLSEIEKNKKYQFELADFFNFFIKQSSMKQINTPNLINCFCLYPFQDIFFQSISIIEEKRKNIYDKVLENKYDGALTDILKLKKKIKKIKRAIQNEYIRKKGIYNYMYPIYNSLSKLSLSYNIDLEYIYEKICYLEKLIDLIKGDFKPNCGLKNLFLNIIIYPDISIFASDIKFLLRRKKNYMITEGIESLNQSFQSHINICDNKKNNSQTIIINNKKIVGYTTFISLLLKEVNSHTKKISRVENNYNIQEYIESAENFYQRFYNIMELYTTLKLRLDAYIKFENFFYSSNNKNWKNLLINIIDNFNYGDSYKLLVNDLNCFFEVCNVRINKIRTLLKFIEVNGIENISSILNRSNELGIVVEDQKDFIRDKNYFRQFLIDFLKCFTNLDLNLVKQNIRANQVLTAIKIDTMCFDVLNKWFQTFKILPNSKNNDLRGFLSRLENDFKFKIVFKVHTLEEKNKLKNLDQKKVRYLDVLNETKIACLDGLLNFVDRNKVLFPNV